MSSFPKLAANYVGLYLRNPLKSAVFFFVDISRR
jgi:hypothetical protein